MLMLQIHGVFALEDLLDGYFLQGVLGGRQLGASLSSDCLMHRYILSSQIFRMPLIIIVIGKQQAQVGLYRLLQQRPAMVSTILRASKKSAFFQQLANNRSLFINADFILIYFISLVDNLSSSQQSRKLQKTQSKLNLFKIKRLQWVLDILIVPFSIKIIYKFQYQFMKHTLHKSLSAACTLNISILSEMPENSQIQSSEYNAEENGNGQFIKIATPNRRAGRFRSLLEADEHEEVDDRMLKCSMLTDTRMDYFRAIEKTLLVQNQNLKNHNNFLIGQIRKMYQKEKHMKKELKIQQNSIKSLKKMNKELEISAQVLSKDLMHEIHLIQAHLTEQSPFHTNSNYRIKTFQDIDSAEVNSQEISQSLGTIKNIFSKIDNQSQQTYQSSKIHFTYLNPEKYPYSFPNLDSIQYRKALNYTENMKRKLENISNHPLIKDLQEKISNLSNDILHKAQASKKGNIFKKMKTMGS